MKKIKGVKKAVEKFNNWEGTARIYIDTENYVVRCETFSTPREGRFNHAANWIEIHNKETLYGKDIVVTDKEILSLCRDELASL